MAVAKRRKTEVRQQQILEAAARLIFKHGCKHLTVKRIASSVGISEAAIYHHFRSKMSILSFLLLQLEEIIIREISSASAGMGPVTIAAIERVIGNHFSSIDQRKEYSFHVIAEIISIGDRKLNKQASQAIGKYICRLKELIADGVRDGAVRRDIDLDASATLLFSMIQGLVNIWALSGCNYKLTEKFESLWRVYRDAIASC